MRRHELLLIASLLTRVRCILSLRLRVLALWLHILSLRLRILTLRLYILLTLRLYKLSRLCVLYFRRSVLHRLLLHIVHLHLILSAIHCWGLGGVGTGCTHRFAGLAVFVDCESHEDEGNYEEDANRTHSYQPEVLQLLPVISRTYLAIMLNARSTNHTSQNGV